MEAARFLTVYDFTYQKIRVLELKVLIVEE
jgi:hypothetical protein